MVECSLDGLLRNGQSVSNRSGLNLEMLSHLKKAIKTKSQVISICLFIRSVLSLSRTKNCSIGLVKDRLFNFFSC